MIMKVNFKKQLAAAMIAGVLTCSVSYASPAVTERENLGSLLLNEKTGEPEIGDLGADAQLNLARGVVVTNAKVVPLPEEDAKVAAAFFGPDGRHDSDYIYYYNNIRDNVAKRIAAYKESR